MKSNVREFRRTPGGIIAGCVLVAVACVWLAGCSEGSDESAPAVAGDETETERLAAEVSALAVENGVDGRITDSRTVVRPSDDPLVRLGRELFFSRTLSVKYDVACATCHHPLLAGGDSLSLPVGVATTEPWRLGPGRTVAYDLDADPLRDCDAALRYCGPNVARNSPTVFNSALYDRAMMLDGRVERVGENTDGSPQFRTPESAPLPDINGGVSILAAQSLLPVANNNEMRGYVHAELAAPTDLRDYLARRFDGIEEEGVDRVTVTEAANWRSLFSAAFPSLSPGDQITYAHIQRALSAYQESLFFVDNRWNRFLRGRSTLSADELAGARLFFQPAASGGLGCASCHAGDHFTDQSFHNTGFPQIGRGKRPDGRDDRGRGDITRDSESFFAFRTPTLLNVARTAPYGHAGTFADLPSLLRFHADPSVERFVVAWPGLAQFAGRDLDTVYPEARRLTAEALAAGSFDRGKLPMRDLTDGEVAQLAAFLGTLTDVCIQSMLCVDDWIPIGSPVPAGDDPDGNLLVMGVASPVDAEIAAEADGGGSGGGDTGGGTGGTVPSTQPLVFGSGASRAGFAEHDRCSASTASNTGARVFAEDAANRLLANGKETWPVPAIDRGPDFRHGFAAEDWFISAPGTKSIQSVMQSGGVTATYLDDDCWPDLVFAGGTQAGVRFYRNNDGRMFNHQPGLLDAIVGLGGYATGVTYVDLDGDYRREFVLGNLYAAAPASGITHVDQDTTLVLARRDDGTFYRAGGIGFLRNTYGISFGDADGDGDPDLYAAHWGVEQNFAGPVFWENRGNALVDAQSAYGLSQAAGMSQQFNFTPSFADFNGDGWQDLVVASDFETSQVLENVADGAGGRRYARRLTDGSVVNDENGMGNVVGDYDNDGDLDWFVTSILDSSGIVKPNIGTTGNRLYENVSDGGQLAFRDASHAAGVRDGEWGWGACMEDMDNDGWIDIFMENGYGYIPPEHGALSVFASSWIAWHALVLNDFLSTPPRLFISNGRNDDGEVTFTESASGWGVGAPSNGRGVACLDFDRDGDIDIVTLEHSGAPHVFVNQTGHGTGRHYLDVQLVGNSPNTDALGARVVVQADLDGSGAVGAGESQLRVAQANMTYNGRGLPNLHFGLRSASTIAQLEVHWPGIASPLVCSNVAADRHVVIDQRTPACP